TIPRMTSDLAIRMAEQEVERLGRELDGLRQATVNLDERLDELRAAIRDTTDRVRTTREALAGAEGRQKAEAVRKVIRRVRLHFEAVADGPAGPACQTAGCQLRHNCQDPTSRLMTATIEPLEGDALTLEVGGQGVVAGAEVATRCCPVPTRRR